MGNTNPSEAEAAKAKAKLEADAAKAKAKAEADAAKAQAEAEAAKAQTKPAKKEAKLDHAAFRRSLASVVPGSRPFGSMPAALMRLEEACAAVIKSQDAVATAKAILDELKAETVTGSDMSGAEAVLGENLPAFEAFIEEAEAAVKQLAGEG